MLMNKALIALLLLSPIILNAAQTNETYECNLDYVKVIGNFSNFGYAAHEGA